MATLAKSNKHLATADQRKRAVRVTVATSSAIEGIHAPFRLDSTAVAAVATGSNLAAKVDARKSR